MNVEMSVNGLSYIASFPDKDIRTLHLPLLRKLTALLRNKQRHEQNDKKQRLNKQRLVVFLAAPPGIGKSTLTHFWQILSHQEVDLQDVQGLPMDGFHHYNSYLDQNNLRARKGAPDTYDLGLLKDHLRQIYQSDATWPAYDRNLHDPVQNAISVTAPIVIIEGNWLLLKEPGWQDLIQYCDYSIFIGSSIENLRERLIHRKMKGGLSYTDAENFFENSDGLNVKRVLSNSQRADLTLMMLTDGSYRPVGRPNLF